MRKGDIVWGGLLVCMATILTVPQLRQVFLVITNAHPYMMGFAKFAILSTMGEYLSLRIMHGNWVIPAFSVVRAIIWGFLGMAIVLAFEVFSSGVNAALTKGMFLLPYSKFTGAFLASTMMNFTFAPVMMGFHRFSDTYLDLLGKQGTQKPTIATVVQNIDWNNFVSFVCLKTIPLFWIPAHTITFLLPPVYRVIVAAFLSIALGLILSFAKRRSGNTETAAV